MSTENIENNTAETATEVVETEMAETMVIESPDGSIEVIETDIVQTEISDTTIIESPDGSIQVIETDAALTEIIETNVIESESGLVEVLETEIYETSIVETDVLVSESGVAEEVQTTIVGTETVETDVIETETGAVELTETTVFETEIIETESGTLEVVETDMSQTEFIETNVIESESGNLEISEREIRETTIVETEIVATESGIVEVIHTTTVETETVETDFIETDSGSVEIIETTLVETEVVETDSGMVEVVQTTIVDTEIIETEIVETENGAVEIVETTTFEIEIVETDEGVVEVIETTTVETAIFELENAQSRPTPAMMASSVRPTAPVVSAPVVETVSDSVRFGRIDDDGTVYLKHSDESETVVGQWAAGTPEEGLAFFARKYDDLAAEIDLAIQRLSEGKASPESPAAAIARAEEALTTPAMVGDVDALRAKLDRLNELIEERRKVIAEERAAARAAALAAREAIVNESETLAESTQWKSTGDRFKALLDDWKVAPRADRASEQALWKRFSHARSQFDKARRQHFAKLDAERDQAKSVKNDLVAQAQELASSTDWGPTAGTYRSLMDQWKAAPRASKSEEDALWTAFKGAQDQFFAARSEALNQRDAGLNENLVAKQALLAEAEAIDPSDLKTAKKTLRSIQERWEKVGHVPRNDKDKIEGRLRKVEESLRTGEQEQWRKSNPEALARAEATVAQFQSSLDKLEKDLAKAQTAGDARKVAESEQRIVTTKALLEAAQRAATEFSG